MADAAKQLGRVVNLTAVAAALGAVGCQSGPRECWGDCALPGVVVMGMLEGRGSFAEVRDGDPVDLTLPVQGGHILFVTARIKNFEKQRVAVLGEVRHPTTGLVAARDERVIDFSIALAEGYGQPDLANTSNAANIAVCPNYLSRDMVGQEWLVDLTVTDSRQLPVKVTRRVLPSCRQTDAAEAFGCRCECLGCFALGKCTGSTAPVGCDGG